MSDFEVQGVDELIRRMKFTDDKLNRSLQLKILKDAGKPIQRDAKANAPVTDDYVKIKGNLIKPGTLKRSIGFITGKSKEWPNVQIGARVKGSFGDYRGGWFAHFVHDGHLIRNRGKSSGTNHGTTSDNPFLEDAYKTNKVQVEENIKKSVVKVVKKGIEKGQL